MSRLVQVLIIIIGTCDFSVGFWRDDDGFACFSQRFNHPFIGIKRFVGNDRVCVNAGQQRIGAVKIMGLSWREMKAGRVAQCIAGGMYFSGQAALAAPDRLLRLIPPFAPAACWWARTMVESIMAYSLSESSARCSNTRFQTPRVLQRVWRVWMTRKSPNRSGKSRHGIPARYRYNTPSTNSRLSFAVTPTVSSRPGSRGSIFAHWSSRNPYRLTIRRLLPWPGTE